MKFDAVDTVHSSWQESLDPKLTRRLMRPIAQPGVAGTPLVESILLRMQAMTERSPLAEQLGQRQHRAGMRSADAVPIVYARPRSDRLGQNVSAADLQPSVRKPSVPVIQAKFACPPDQSLTDFSLPQTDPDSSTWEPADLPLVRAKLAIQPVPNVVAKDAVQIYDARPRGDSQNVSAADLQPSVQKPSVPVIQAKFPCPPEKSLTDFSRPPLDKHTDPDSSTWEPADLPLVRAKLAIQPVQNLDARPRGDRLGQNVSAADLQPSVRKPSEPVIQAKFARPPEQGDSSTRDLSAQQSGKTQSAQVIQAKFASPSEESLADFSRPPLDKHIDPDSSTPEPANLPLVRAKLAIQPVPNVVKTLAKDDRNGAIGPEKSAATGSVTQNATGQKPVVRAKNRNTSPKTLVVQRKLVRPVVRENLIPDGGVLATPSTDNSTGKTLVVQRKLARPVVRETSRPDGGRSPVPLVFASSTNNVPPASNGRGRTGNRAVSSHNTVVQRFASSNNNVSSRTGILPANNQFGNNGVIQAMPSSDSFSASPSEIVQRSPATDHDSDLRSAENRELGNEVKVDVEDLVDRVQRRLMQRLTIETERRGLRGLTRWL